MKLSYTKECSESIKIKDCLILPFIEDETAFPAFQQKLFESSWKKAVDKKDFKGKKNECFFLYHGDDRLILLGLGKQKDIDQETLRLSFAEAVKTCCNKKYKDIQILFPDRIEMEKDFLFRGVSEGIFLSNYSFVKLKSKTRNNYALIENVELLGIDQNELQYFEKAKKLTAAVNFVRDLVNNNAQEISSKKFNEIALEMEKEFSELKVTCFDKKRIEEENMGLLLAVNQGSFHDPAFIIMEYKNNPESKDHVVLVGKGVTFDTGGLCLKPANKMHEMKSDMAGAAAVMGTIYAALLLKLKVNLTVIIPATDNAIDARSYRPGDVFKSYSGETVEVVNTDAEGRLILADALAYAEKNLNPTVLMDIATLTGAVSIALGGEITGMLTDDDLLSQEIISSGHETGEHVWRLPLYKKYRKSLDSKIADIKNCGDSKGSVITSALFLKEFVKKVSWAHLDIGGSSYYSDPKGYHTTPATGAGVRLFIEFLEKRFKL